MMSLSLSLRGGIGGGGKRRRRWWWLGVVMGGGEGEGVGRWSGLRVEVVSRLLELGRRLESWGRGASRCLFWKIWLILFLSIAGFMGWRGREGEKNWSKDRALKKTVRGIYDSTYMEDNREKYL